MRIEPGELRIPGPAGVDLQPSWARTPVERISGTTEPLGLPPTELEGLAFAYAVGKIGDQGEVGFAVFLFRPSEPMDPFVVERYICAQGAPISSTALEVGVLGVLEGQSQDRVIVIGETSWTTIGPEGPEVQNFSPIPGTSPVSVFLRWVVSTQRQRAADPRRVQRRTK